MTVKAENSDFKRVNITVSEEVKTWYQEQAKKYGMSMSALMAYTLAKNYENMTAAETMKDLSALMKEAKEEGVTVESNQEMMTQMIEMMSIFKGEQE